MNEFYIRIIQKRSLKLDLLSKAHSILFSEKQFRENGMNPAIIALLGFIFWTLFLGLGVVSIRSFKVLTGSNKSNEFPAGIKHGSEFYWRLNRAHINCIENLPVFGILVLIGVFAGVLDNRFELVTQIILGARIFQTLSHLSSGSVLAVNARFTGFMIQYGCFLYLLWHILYSTQII
ncbi:MAPEG family protein [Leptospira noguchii str. 1993005606]|uniref:MAPEG family protein n=1 Tax=Leptospira noguchii str. 2007001578 TaxID=1049974 RepID=A0ABN0J759_9LEPT|nr:MAPEG family protein [Leptospira noguchii str. 2007001578]EPE86478.1 MAPEG family protein [Leptospira noguchii str. 1993005606]